MVSGFQEYLTPTNYAHPSSFQTDSPQSPTMSENEGSNELWGLNSGNYMRSDSTISNLKRERSFDGYTSFTSIPVKTSSSTRYTPSPPMLDRTYPFSYDMYSTSRYAQAPPSASSSNVQHTSLPQFTSKYEMKKVVYVPHVVYKDRFIEKPIEKIVYKDRIVEKPVEKIVFKDRVIEKIVYKDRVIEKPVDKIVYKERIIEKPIVQIEFVRSRPSCAICIDEISDDKNVIIISCGHNFCNGCIRKWWTDQQSERTVRTCPRCNRKYRSGSDDSLLKTIYQDFD